jgi:hypothetical protein
VTEIIPPAPIAPPILVPVASTQTAAAAIILQQPLNLPAQLSEQLSEQLSGQLSAQLPINLQAQVLAVEKLPNALSQITVQTTQGEAVLQTTQKIDVGQLLQLKIMPHNIAQLVLLPDTKMALPQTLPQPTQLWPSTVLPPLNSTPIIAQPLMVPTPLAQLQTLLSEKTVAGPLLQSQLQQWQMLPLNSGSSALPHVLQQGLNIFQNLGQQFSVPAPQISLPHILQQQLNQQNFALTLPAMQLSGLPLLVVQQPIKNFIPQFMAPNLPTQLMQPLYIMPPGVMPVANQPINQLATPFSTKILQQAQPWLALGQVPSQAATILNLPVSTQLMLTPQGFVGVPPQLLQNSPALQGAVPGTVFLMQAVPLSFLTPADAKIFSILMTKPAVKEVSLLQTIPHNLLTNELLANDSTLPILGVPWQGLDDLWQGLDLLGVLRAVPANAAPNLAQLPSLPLAIMQMLGALKKNDASLWLGIETVTTLNKTIEGRKLLQIFTQLAEKHQQTLQEVWRDNWQPLPLPLLYDSKWQILPVFYRHQENQQPQTADDEQTLLGRSARITRFLVQLPQTQWGAMQLDGFLQTAQLPNTPTQLDMILRTEYDLAKDLVNGLQARYAQVLGALGYIGQINCQAVPQAMHVTMVPPQTQLTVQS